MIVNIDIINKKSLAKCDMYAESWTHVMNQAEHMDAILYITGGIHFVFRAIRQKC